MLIGDLIKVRVNSYRFAYAVYTFYNYKQIIYNL